MLSSANDVGYFDQLYQQSFQGESSAVRYCYFCVPAKTSELVPRNFFRPNILKKSISDVHELAMIRFKITDHNDLFY